MTTRQEALIILEQKGIDRKTKEGRKTFREIKRSIRKMKSGKRYLKSIDRAVERGFNFCDVVYSFMDVVAQ